MCNERVTRLGCIHFFRKLQAYWIETSSIGSSDELNLLPSYGPCLLAIQIRNWSYPAASHVVAWIGTWPGNTVCARDKRRSRNSIASWFFEGTRWLALITPPNDPAASIPSWSRINERGARNIVDTRKRCCGNGGYIDALAFYC